MKLGRAALFAAMAASLAACGGNDNSRRNLDSPPDTGGDTDSCSLSARQDWARGVLEEWYLFPELLNTNVNQAAYSDVQSYLNAIVAQARAERKDRFFTFITSIEEENELINSGSNAGFGVRLTYDEVQNRVFVAEAFENAPGFQAGFDRGTEILSVDGQSTSSIMAAGGAQAFSEALGPSEPGITRSFSIRSRSGVVSNPTVTKAEFSLDPVSDRYGVKILDDGSGGQVGYVNLRTFIVQDAAPQLRDAFQQFRDRGITNVILDLRYNGGGLVSVAELLGDLMAEGLEGQIFSRTILRPSKSAEDSTDLFEQQPQQIRAMKLAVIGRGGTASASELVTNSMIPYLGNNIALIGTNTFGKPVGQFAFDRSACDDRLRAVTFKTVNANDQGEYFDGLASVMPNTCRAGDDLTAQLGDSDEASVSVALDFIAGRSCTPISASAKDGSVKAEGGSTRLLQPDMPSAVQRDVPGLY